MIDKETMITLKQLNVSVDADKTRERMRKIWKELPKSKRDEILRISDLSRSTADRVYKNGKIQAKMVVALSYVLKIDPLYITGRSDEQREFDESLIVDFLKKLGYSGVRIVKERRSSRNYLEKTTSVPADEDPEIAEPDDFSDEDNKKDNIGFKIDSNISGIGYKDIYENLSNNINPDLIQKIGKLTEEECIMLLKSQFIQSGFDADKENRLALIKYMLIL